jgi:hypothetical protein
VRYVRTDSFLADYRKLSADERDLFRRAVRQFNVACDRFVEERDPSVWPASLRVKAVRGAPGIWEMTWSFAGPDGRATWEWTTVTDDDGPRPAILWRRIGGHAIFREP